MERLNDYLTLEYFLAKIDSQQNFSKLLSRVWYHRRTRNRNGNDFTHYQYSDQKQSAVSTVSTVTPRYIPRPGRGVYIVHKYLSSTQSSATTEFTKSRCDDTRALRPICFVGHYNEPYSCVRHSDTYVYAKA